MKEVNAAIITIGDELLIGQTIDTNSAFIAQELNKIGVWLRRRIAVGDDANEIRKALDEECKNADIVIMTGGLGPTTDDITKPLLCEYFGGKMIRNEEVLKHIEYLFEKIYQRKGPLLERNIKQADVPDNCIVLMNEKGTAPGMWFDAPSIPLGGSGKAQPSLKSDTNNDLEENFDYETADPMNYALLKQFVKEHRSKPTEAEDALWHQLRGKQLGKNKFRRQHIIGNFIADFVCLPKKLIIEVDGLIHQLPDNQVSDEARTLVLQNKGYNVIRFTNDEVLHHMDKVLTKILFELKQSESNNDTNPREAGASANSPLGGRAAVVVSLPGVPHEMKGLMQKEVLPRLQKLFHLPVIIHQTLLTYGVGESILAEAIKDWEESLPSYTKLAYLPHYGMVRLRLTATGDEKDHLEQEIEKQTAQLKDLVKQWLTIDEDLTMQQVVAKFLKERKQTVGTAESCTGGYIAHLLTMDPGASSNFKGTVVAYDNEVKKNILGVSQETLESEGAVSEEVVTQMVNGVLQNLKTDYALATSGIMGPDGGSEKKPVGMVWIAVGNNEKIIAKEFHFRFDRMRNIEQTAIAALAMLQRFIKGQSK